MMIRSIVIALVAISLYSHSAEARTLCEKPKQGLKVGESNVRGELAVFSFRGNTYPVEIYSGFAPQLPNVASSNYCIRYEVENKAKEPVEKFYWPMVGWSIERLEAYKSTTGRGDRDAVLSATGRQSVVRTSPPGTPPAIKETELFAFLSSAEKSFAFQKDALGALFRKKYADASKPSMLAQVSPPRLNVDQIKDFPWIGSEYSGSGAEVTATSSGSSDGKMVQIEIGISRSDSKLVPKIVAPFAYAMAKAAGSENIVPATKEFAFAPIPLERNEYAVKREFPIRADRPFVFIVEQPIILDGPAGKVCFLAATYSPVEIPENFFSCKIF